MKIDKYLLESIIKEEILLFLESKNNKSKKKLKKLFTNESFKQDFIANTVSKFRDETRFNNPQWVFEEFKPFLKKNFGLKPKEAAILLNHMKENGEISDNFFKETKEALKSLLPRGSKLIKDFPEYKPQLKNVRNPVPMGPHPSEK